MTWIIHLFMSMTWRLVLWPQMPIVNIVQVEWFPTDSDATKIVSYRYNNWPEDKLDMISTFLCEKWDLNVNWRSPTRDAWICQLHYNSTNRVWIDDPRRWDWQFQAKVCMDKRNAVADKNIWTCYAKRHKYKSKIILPDNKKTWSWNLYSCI